MEQNKEYDKVNVASNDVSFENYNDIWLLIKLYDLELDINLEKLQLFLSPTNILGR